MPTTLYLIRHGATAANLAHPPRLQGRKRNTPLTRFGILQSQAARDQLSHLPISACYSSPLARARHTAEIVGEGLGLSPIPEEGLTECDVGAWEGLDWQSIRYFDAYNYSRFMSDPDRHGYPGGETILELHDRAKRAFETILERHAGQSVVVVSHYLVNRVFLAGIEGVQLDPPTIATLDSGTVSVLTHQDRQFRFQLLEGSTRPERRAA